MRRFQRVKDIVAIFPVLILAAFLTGCGVAATPYTVAKACESNQWITCRGQIVNEQGESVWYMTRLHIYYFRYTWHPFHWDVREPLELDVKPNWKGEYEFSLYHNTGDGILVGITSPGYQAFWLKLSQDAVWLEDKSGSDHIGSEIAFKYHPELKSRDSLRIVLQRVDSPHEPRIPTVTAPKTKH